MAKALTLDHLELHALKSANYTDKKILELSNSVSNVISSELAEAKASGEFDGEKGDPGVSATHSWNGTTLTVTSASGTSSANLKGEKGANGTSVTVSSVSESTASGGSNVVNFSDGKKVTIKNGIDGKAPVKGTDYWTNADKQEIINTSIVQLSSEIEAEVDSRLDGAKADIAAEIISQLGGMPVFGTVDSNKTITVTSTLEGGTYTLKYTNADGTTSEIGNITIEGTSSGDGTDPGTGTDTKNLVKKATDANTTELYEGCGYKNNTYLSSSNGTPSDKAEYVTTGFIPHDGTSTFYIKGADWVAGDSGCRVMFYNSSYTKYNEGEFYILGSHTSNVTRTVENDYVKVQFNANMTIVKQGAYMRMCLKGTGENLKIYRAQDI